MEIRSVSQRGQTTSSLLCHRGEPLGMCTPTSVQKFTIKTAVRGANGHQNPWGNNMRLMSITSPEAESDWQAVGFGICSQEVS